MKTIQLKLRQCVLLSMIADDTRMSDAGLLYFVPHAKSNWSAFLKEHIHVGGSDASILRSFERRGWTENADSSLNPYCCRITVKGRAILSTQCKRTDAALNPPAAESGDGK